MTRAVPGPVVLATDASVGRKHAAIGFLATTGHTGLRAHLYPEHLARPRTRVTVSELRAVHWGLKPVLAARPGSPVEVRVDSLDALRYLRAWQNGGTRMPEGYETGLRSQGRRPSLLQLQMCVEYTPNLTFVHEKAHVGNPLNEAADSLAKLGLRTVRGTVPPDEVPRLVPLWAAAALDEYRRTPDGRSAR
ncbi:RNase H family protein [Streptomyces sp. NPDC094448]|uniref:RNase H family protein n=1 Tax=Streptomyces sp. NPDC094448 TaxID=3366063 RepID=UPI0038189D02